MKDLILAGIVGGVVYLVSKAKGPETAPGASTDPATGESEGSVWDFLGNLGIGGSD